MLQRRLTEERRAPGSGRGHWGSSCVARFETMSAFVAVTSGGLEDVSLLAGEFSQHPMGAKLTSAPH